LVTDHTTLKPVVSIIGDIRQVTEVHAALVGVSAVIHVAGIVDVSVFPNIELMRDVNEQGLIQDYNLIFCIFI